MLLCVLDTNDLFVELGRAIFERALPLLKRIHKCKPS